MTKKHKHIWKIGYLQYEYPEGYAGTAQAIQYAFLLCQCESVKKVDMTDIEKLKNLEAQIDRLAKFIMFNIPSEPSQSEGACDTAIRLLGHYIKLRQNEPNRV